MKRFCRFLSSVLCLMVFAGAFNFALANGQTKELAEGMYEVGREIQAGRYTIVCTYVVSAQQTTFF